MSVSPAGEAVVDECCGLGLCGLPSWVWVGSGSGSFPDSLRGRFGVAGTLCVASGLALR